MLSSSYLRGLLFHNGMCCKNTRRSLADTWPKPHRGLAKALPRPHRGFAETSPTLAWPRPDRGLAEASPKPRSCWSLVESLPKFRRHIFWWPYLLSRPLLQSVVKTMRKQNPKCICFWWFLVWTNLIIWAFAFCLNYTMIKIVLFVKNFSQLKIFKFIKNFNKNGHYFLNKLLLFISLNSKKNI